MVNLPKWIILPDKGRTRSGLTLMPYTESPAGGSLSYRFTTATQAQRKVKVHVVVKSTLDTYLNKGGLTYQVSLDGSSPSYRQLQQESQ